MWIIQEPKKVALWNKRHFEERNGECAACLKYSVLIFVEKIYKMQHLEGSSTPVLYRGRTVLTGYVKEKHSSSQTWRKFQEGESCLCQNKQPKFAVQHKQHLNVTWYCATCFRYTNHQLALVNTIRGAWWWFVRTETCSPVLCDVKELCWTMNFVGLWYTKKKTTTGCIRIRKLSLMFFRRSLAPKYTQYSNGLCK